MFGKMKAYDSSNAQYVSNSSESTSCDSVEEQDVEYGRKDDSMFRGYGYNQCSNDSMTYGNNHTCMNDSMYNCN